MVRPQAYKSDMWRMLMLWKHGGVYLDAKLGLNAPMEKWISFDNDQYLTCNTIEFTLTNGVQAMS